jgi:hypothetical protein
MLWKRGICLQFRNGSNTTDSAVLFQCPALASSRAMQDIKTRCILNHSLFAMLLWRVFRCCMWATFARVVINQTSMEFDMSALQSISHAGILSDPGPYRIRTKHVLDKYWTVLHLQKPLQFLTDRTMTVQRLKETLHCLESSLVSWQNRWN